MHLSDLPDLTALTQSIPFDPKQLVGIPFALVGAVFMSVGAQLQHRGVGKVGTNSGGLEKSGLNFKQFLSLFGRPSWLIGTTLLGLAIVFQLISLGFSPLIVVQPIGAIALVITAILNARVTKTHLNRASIAAVVLCVGGIAIFVTVAAFTARNAPMTSHELQQILIVLIIVLLLSSAAYFVFKKYLSALIYIVGAGVLYGFVATLAKVVITSILQGTQDPLMWACLVGLVAAAALGAVFVQNAYSSGPPDLVIAGLTVVDPIVAVTIGIVILHEASQAPWWAGIIYAVAGFISVVGVFLLAKFHPHAGENTATAAQPIVSK